jgi:hypothetical protein
LAALGGRKTALEAVVEFALGNVGADSCRELRVETDHKTHHTFPAMNPVGKTYHIILRFNLKLLIAGPEPPLRLQCARQLIVILVETIKQWS